jgi:hypothetical protein
MPEFDVTLRVALAKTTRLRVRASSAEAAEDFVLKLFEEHPEKLPPPEKWAQEPEAEISVDAKPVEGSGT